jgi:Amino-transferase class IV
MFHHGKAVKLGKSQLAKQVVHCILRSFMSTTELKIYLDGKLVPESEAKVSVFDHGLLYGDGVFEGIRIYNGRVFRLAEHLRRLYSCARAICLTIPISIDEMEKATLQTVAANNLRDGYIRLVVTRGVGSLGLNHHREFDQTLPGRALRQWPETHHVCNATPLSGSAESAGEIAQLPEQHHGQDRGHAGRV